MKIRRIFPLVLAFMLVMSIFSCAQAQTVETGRYTLEAWNAALNVESNTIAVQDRTTGLYTLITKDGQPLTTESYIYMSSTGAGFEVAVEDGLNVRGLIDGQGKLLVPTQYGVIDYLSDRWQIGIKLVEATADNYDYKSFGGDLYLVETHDVYYCGQLVGSMERTAYSWAVAHGSYLYVRDKDGNYAYYDSSFARSAYQDDYPGSSEYESVYDKGIFHRGSGQQAFVPECTLTEEEVDRSVYLVECSVVDLQGNEVGVVNSEYDIVRAFVGDHATVYMNEKYGLIDTTGREILPCEYDEINSGDQGFFEGGYQVVIKDGKVGYVNQAGEVTCEFKYSENVVDSVYRMPMTSLVDMEGNSIVLSGAVGELPERYADVRISVENGCPLFAAEDLDGNAGVVDLYGQVVVLFDGTYDDIYDLSFSRDGSVVLGYTTDKVYVVYSFEQDGEAAVPAVKAETAVVEEDDEPEAAAAEEDDGSWACECGQKNTGKFCTECGKARPADKLVCSECGFEPEEGTAPKFCSECGNAF